MSEETGEAKPENTSEAVNTGGGAYVAESVHTAGGDFYGRDYNQTIVHGVPIEDIEHLPPEVGDPPYQGLRYFDETDADWFFGREQVTVVLVNRLHETNFLAVVGASGSGKSSIARAGVIPAMKGSKPLSDGSVPPLGDWQVKVMTPTARPLDKLVVTLFPDDKSRQSEMYGRLSANPNVLRDALTETVMGDRPLLLVVDQFEELFSQCKDEQQREMFIANLVASAQPTCKIILTLRADFYDSCLQYESLCPIFESSQKTLSTMSDEELREAILAPAAKGNWKFQEGLVELMLEDVGQEPGALPLLSHALRETWERRRGRVLTLSGYREAGGVKGAIAQTAETVYKNLTPDEQALSQQIFLRLTGLGEGTQDTRRRLGRAELHDDPLTAELTKKLADARLITTTENGLEVAHEALIREWPRLREWLDAGRKGLLIHRRLTIAASEWQERAKDTSLLYRGIRLAEAEDWKKNVNQQLNEQECQFLLASIEEREQEEIKTEEYRRKTAELQSQKQVGQVLKAATIVVVFFFLTAVFFAFEASNKADEAQQLKNVLLAKDMISAMQAEPLPDGEVALKLAIASLGLNAQVDTQGSLYEAFFSPHRITLNGEVNPRASFSPNGDLIMAFSPLGAVRVWRTDGTEVIRLFGKHTSINSASFSPAGDLILTTSLDDGNALVRKLDGTVLGSVGHKDGVHSASFNPTGDLILTTGGDGTAKVWELDGTLQTTLTGHTGWWVSSAAFNSAGDKIVTAGDDSTAKVWTIDGVELATLTGHTNRVSTAIFSPAGDLIVTTSADGTAKLWELDGTEVATLATPTDWVRSAAFNPAGNLIVTASDDSTAKVWGIDGTLLATLTGHTNQVSVASFNHAGDMIVTASDDGTAKVWNIDGTLLTTLKRHTGTVLSAAFDPTDGMIVTASADGTVMVWELHDNGQVTLPRMNLAEDLTMITAIVGPTLRDPLATFSPGGDKVVIAINGEISFYGEGQLLTKSINNEALVWGVNGNLLTKLTGHKEAILSAAFHPAGNMIVTASSDKPVKVWGVDGTLLTTLRGHRDVVLLATFNPEGNMIITASKDGTVKFWAVDGTLLGTRGILEDQLSATLSPKGNLMITVDQNHTARVWGINDNDQTAQMWQIDDVLQAEFSPANNMIITVNNDGTAKVWGIDGKELAVLTGSDQIESATFNPSGNLIVTTGGAIRVWGVDGTLQVALPVEGSSAIFSPTSDLILTVSDDIARIWGIDGTPRSVLSGHLANLAIFSPSGDLIITVDNEGGARLWPTIPSIVEEAYLRINRGFSETECLQYFRDDLDACPRTKEELFAPLAHYITNP